MRFSPAAWAKLLFLRDAGPTEIGGFGIAPPDDLLYVEDVRVVRQWCTAMSVEFDDTSVAEFFDEQVDAGRRPEQFGRIWVHTHPADCPLPSSTDERTSAEVFGRSDWSVMFILAAGGASYARLQFRAGPGAALVIPVRIDWGRPFAGTDAGAWQAEYLACVNLYGSSGDFSELDLWDDPQLLHRRFHSRLREDQQRNVRTGGECSSQRETP